MALHKDFPTDPYVILDPSIRWFPADEALREHGSEKLLPPLVAELRKQVNVWRDAGYAGASSTSRSLLRWWFLEEHDNFRYYFAQREAMETVIWLYEVAQVKDKFDLIRYNATGVLSPGMFVEDWLRLVIKMATGAGKTKVMSLVIAWAYFHRKYEDGSRLAKNFLVITPNVIVFERIKSDFEGLKIFFNDPVLPDDGYAGCDWRSDFQPTLHLQDALKSISDTGNIFLTNIHRVYESDVRVAGPDDDDSSEYFLGPKPVAKTNDSTVDLGMIVRDIDELIVINDEAHHIHDDKLAWFSSIRDIANRLKLKGGDLSLQIDVTATPKKNDGSIFVQTVSDYPLVEAIRQQVVKTPVVPDGASRGKLKEKESVRFSERYRDYINLGVEEWRKTYERLEPMDKKSILFIMTDDTKNCDDVVQYIEKSFADLQGAVLTIHTNKSGEISESITGKSKEELDRLRTQANAIDSWESPYKVIVSVLMLKEGWDVKNVTTIVGLRPYAADSKILPEQTLGRGLRRMFFGREDVEEYVSVIGTAAFMDFVESIKGEGIILEKRPMGQGTPALAPTVVEIDAKNQAKDIAALDIEIPVLAPRIQREYKSLSQLDVAAFRNEQVPVKQFTKEEQREIVFKDVVDETTHHTTILTGEIEPDSSSVIGFFTQKIMRELRLFGCYDILYGKVKEFLQSHLFDHAVDLSDMNVLRNLSEVEYVLLIQESFKSAINALTVQDRGDTEIRNFLKVSEARPFVVSNKGFLVPKKSVFNKIVGDSDFELKFASFLEECDIISFSKNYQQKETSALRIEYQNADGGISTYYPDFFVKWDEKTVYIIETKGRQDANDPLKFRRLQLWCADVNDRQSKMSYQALYIPEEVWDKHTPSTFDECVRIFAAKD